jgi:HK97 family phage portal protein
MSVLTRGIAGGLFGASPNGGGGAQPATGPQDIWLQGMFASGKSYTGKSVTVESSLQFDAVLGCVRLLSESIGAMPLKVYTDADPRVEARNTWQWELLKRRTNPELPPIDFWALIITWLNTWGNAFVGKQIRGNKIVALWPIEPHLVQVARENGKKAYYVQTGDGRFDRYGSDSIIHFRGFSLDGLVGLSPISLMREAIGAGLAADEYANRFYAHGALPVGVLESDHVLDDEVQRRLARNWQKKYGGLRNAGRVAVLEQGLKWRNVTLPMKDLEFVAQQQMSAKKIARAFRVPASMIDANDGDKSLTYRTVEGDNLQYLVHTLRPWLKRIAQNLEMDYDLFPPGSGPGFIVEHVVDDLLMTETLTRFQAHQIAVGNQPWKLPSDIAKIENDVPHPELDERAKAMPVAPPTSENKGAPTDRGAELELRQATLEQRSTEALERIAEQKPPVVNVPPPSVRFEAGAIQVEAAPPANVEVKIEEGAIAAPPPANVEVRIEEGAIQLVNEQRPRTKTVTLPDGQTMTVADVEEPKGD